MIGQCQRDAVTELRLRKLAVRVEQDRAIAAEAELGIELAKRLDQIGLAVKIKRDLIIRRFIAVDADRAAAFALAGEIGDLSPFQRLFERADAVGFPCSVEDQLAQRLELAFDPRVVGLESCRNYVILVVLAARPYSL